MNHDNLGNYSRSYVSDLRAQLQAANERADRAETALHQCLTVTGEEAGDRDDFLALVNSEQVTVQVTVDAVRGMKAELDTTEAFYRTARQTNAALKAEVEGLKQWKREASDELFQCGVDIVKLNQQITAARALNDTLAGALKELVDQDDHQEPFNGLDMSNGRAALSAYAKSKEAAK